MTLSCSLKGVEGSVSAVMLSLGTLGTEPRLEEFLQHEASSMWNAISQFISN